ncbi:MAG: flavodoxin [Bacteroidales bacterium]|nr:flavodoxin [Bacteroidales bacterium]
MKKTALIYSYNTKKSKKIAEKIKEAFNDEAIEIVNAEELTEELFLSYDQFVMGVSTWFDGELPNYWDEFVPAIEDMDLKGKRFALFGLGDQKGYPENFQDGIGIMAEILEKQGGKIIGFTSAEGYTFEKSRGLRDDKFTGLAIDFENQSSKTDERIAAWVKQLKSEFS